MPSRDHESNARSPYPLTAQLAHKWYSVRVRCGHGSDGKDLARQHVLLCHTQPLTQCIRSCRKKKARWRTNLRIRNTYSGCNAGGMELVTREQVLPVRTSKWDEHLAPYT